MPAVDDRVGRYIGDPWDQQPNETAYQYARFLEYVELSAKDRRAGYTTIAANHGVSESTIREVAERWRWRERAALRDADKKQARLEEMAEKEAQLADRAMNLALVATSIMARTLRTIADSNTGIAPEDLPAWARMVEVLRKVAIDAPDQLVALTGSNGGAVPVRIEKFDGLTPAQVRDGPARWPVACCGWSTGAGRHDRGGGVGPVRGAARRADRGIPARHPPVPGVPGRRGHVLRPRLPAPSPPRPDLRLPRPHGHRRDQTPAGVGTTPDR